MSKSRKISYSAFGLSISGICVLLGQYTPMSFSPLLFAVLCFFIVFDKCGIWYCGAVMIMTLGLGLLFAAYSSVFFLLIMFIPYVFIYKICQKLPDKIGKAKIVLSYIIKLVFFNLALYLLSLLVMHLNINFNQIIEKLFGIVALFVVLANIFFLITDYLMKNITEKVYSILKI